MSAAYDVVEPRFTEALARLRNPKQSDAERDHREGENHGSSVNQRDRSTGFGGRGWKHGEKEARRNQNRSQWHSDSDCPKQGAREDCSVRKDLAYQRKNHNDSRVGMPGAKEVLTQRVLHITAALVYQRSQKKISTVLNRRHRNEDNSGHQSGFASHSSSFCVAVRSNLQ